MAKRRAASKWTEPNRPNPERHVFTPEEAREAGRKGGQAVTGEKKREAGRKGGLAKAHNRNDVGYKQPKKRKAAKKS